MKLDILIKSLKRQGLYIPEKFENLNITSICHDSRRATPTSIFVCRKGSIVDGHEFAMGAYSNGARVFVVEREIDVPHDSVIVTVDSCEDALFRLSRKFFDAPEDKMSLIGITGTKGKTTLALSIFSLLNQNGEACGYIGTNGVLFGDEEYQTQNTTPDTYELHKYLRKMLDAGCKSCVIEVSSQALWQNRIRGLKFKQCIFTNLYEDHIGGCEHPDMEHYKACKRRLFTSFDAETVITNIDSPESDYMTKNASAQSIITTSASGNEAAHIFAKNPRIDKKGGIPGVKFDLCFNPKLIDIEDKPNLFIPAPGIFSIENTLEIIAEAITLGLPIKNILKTLSNLQVSGRFEFLTLKTKPGVLFCIDYAHNGTSLKKVLSSLAEYTKGRIICVFGSVGGRTFGRRSELGAVARDFADVSIITADNPNFEDPMHVIDEIAKEFCGSDKEIYKICDRKEAIRLAYDISKRGDTVLLAGKGHENYQLIRGERIPFSEKEILNDIVCELEYSPV